MQTDTSSSNQNQTVLTPNDELDILEAVYHVGQKKGMELLNAEQMKKLIDSNRINQSNSSTVSTQTQDLPVATDSNLEIDPLITEAVDGSFLAIKSIKAEIINNRHHFTTESDWQSWSPLEKHNIIEKVFVGMYGVSSQDFAFELFKTIIN